MFKKMGSTSTSIQIYTFSLKILDLFQLSFPVCSVSKVLLIAGKNFLVQLFLHFCRQALLLSELLRNLLQVRVKEDRHFVGLIASDNLHFQTIDLFDACILCVST